MAPLRGFLVYFPKKDLLVYNRYRLFVQEAEMHNLTRITFNPEVMGGKLHSWNAGDGGGDCGIGRFWENG